VSPRQRALLLVIALVPFLVLVALHWPILPLLPAGDYAQYLLHADALVHGRSYSDIGYIYTAYNPFIGPVNQPPGLPLTLVPLLAIGGHSLVLPKALMVVSALVFICLAGIYFGRRTSPWIGAGAVAMTGIAVEIMFGTNTVMSDLGFAALVWAAVATIDREGRWSAGRAAAVCVLTLAALAYRAAGVALVPALFLWVLVHRRDRGPYVYAPLVVLGALAIIALIFASDVAPVTLVLTSLAGLTHRLVSNIGDYRFALFASELYPFPGKLANIAYHVGATVLVVIGLARYVRREWRSFLVIFAAVYATMLALAPVADARYAWPLFPLIATSLLAGASWLVTAVAARRGRTLAPDRAVFGLALAGAIASAVVAAARPVPNTLLEHADVQALFGQIRSRHSSEPMRVVFMNPRVLTWETGVPAMGLFAAQTDDVIAELRDKRITHVIVGDLGQHPAANGSIEEAIRDRSGYFHPEYRNASFAVYRFTTDSSAAAGQPAAGNRPSP
jgi:hypothetical protein